VGRRPNILFQCISNPTYAQYRDNNYETVGCGSRYSSIIFCFSFLVLVILIFLNLFIAIIVDGYRSSVERNKKMFNSEMKEKFREAWSKYDQDATGFMKIKKFPKMMLTLGGKFGWDESFKKDK